MSQINIQTPDVLVRPNVDVYQEGRTYLPQQQIQITPGIDYAGIGEAALGIGQVFAQSLRDKKEDEFFQKTQKLEKYAEDTEYAIKLAKLDNNQDQINASVSRFKADVNQLLGVPDHDDDANIPVGRLPQKLFYAARNLSNGLRISAGLETAVLGKEERDAAFKAGIATAKYRISQAQTPEETKAENEAAISIISAYMSESGFKLPERVKDQTVEDYILSLSQQTRTQRERIELASVIPDILDVFELSDRQLAGIDKAIAAQEKAIREQLGARLSGLSEVVKGKIAEIDARDAGLIASIGDKNLPPLSEEENARIIRSFVEAQQVALTYFLDVSNSTGIDIPRNEKGESDIPEFLTMLANSNLIPKTEFDNITSVYKAYSEVTSKRNVAAKKIYSDSLNKRSDSIKRRSAATIADAETKIAQIESSTLPPAIQAREIQRIVRETGLALQSIISGPMLQEAMANHVRTLPNGIPMLLANSETTYTLLSGFDIRTANVDATAYNTGLIEPIADIRLKLEEFNKKHIKTTSKEAYDKQIRHNEVNTAVITGELTPQSKAPTQDEIYEASLDGLSKFGSLVSASGEKLDGYTWLSSLSPEVRQKVPASLFFFAFGTDVLNEANRADPERQRELFTMIGELSPSTVDANITANFRVGVRDDFLEAFGNSLTAPNPTALTYRSFLGYPKQSRNRAIATLQKDDRYKTDPIYKNNVDRLQALSNSYPGGGRIEEGTIDNFVKMNEVHLPKVNTMFDSGFISFQLFTVPTKAGGSEENRKRQDEYRQRNMSQDGDVVRTMASSVFKIVPELEGYDIASPNDTTVLEDQTKVVLSDAMRYAYGKMTTQETPLHALDPNNPIFKQAFSEAVGRWVFTKDASGRVSVAPRQSTLVPASPQEIRDTASVLGLPTTTRDEHANQIIKDTLLETMLPGKDEPTRSSIAASMFNPKAGVDIRGDPVGSVLSLIKSKVQPTRELASGVIGLLEGKDPTIENILIVSYLAANGQELTDTNFTRARDTVRNGQLMSKDGQLSFVISGRRPISIPVNAAVLHGTQPSPSFANGLGQKQVIMELTRALQQNEEPQVSLESRMLEVVESTGEPQQIQVSDRLLYTYRVNLDADGNKTLVRGMSKLVPFENGIESWVNIGSRPIMVKQNPPQPESDKTLVEKRTDAGALARFKDNPDTKTFDRLISTNSTKYGDFYRIYRYTKQEDGSIIRQKVDRSIILGNQQEKVVDTAYIHGTPGSITFVTPKPQLPDATSVDGGLNVLPKELEQPESDKMSVGQKTDADALARFKDNPDTKTFDSLIYANPTKYGDFYRIYRYTKQEDGSIIRQKVDRSIILGNLQEKVVDTEYIHGMPKQEPEPPPPSATSVDEALNVLLKALEQPEEEKKKIFPAVQPTELKSSQYLNKYDRITSIYNALDTLLKERKVR